MTKLIPSVLSSFSAAFLFTYPAASEPFTIGVGLGAFPQYEGAADYDVLILPSFRGSIAGFDVRSSGPGIELDLLRSRAFDVGPILRYDFGRDPASIDNIAVSALPKIDASLNVGGYLQVNIPISSDFRTFLSPRVSVLKGVGTGPGGVLVEPSLGLLYRGDKWILGSSISTTFASDVYMDSYFSIAETSPSGLTAFSASEGFKDIGVSLFANYKINDAVSASVVGGFRRLIGDAAESPIVSVEGNANQMFISVGLSYSFN